LSKMAFILSLVVTVAPALASAEEHGQAGAEQGHASHGEEAGGHGAGALNWFDMSDPETPPLGIMFVNFALLLMLVYMIIRKPIGNRVRTRRQGLEQALAEATRAKAEAEAALAEARARMEALDLEMAKVRRDLLEAGKAESARIVEEAERRAARTKDDTAALVEQEIARMTAAVRAEVVERVVEVAREALTRKIQAGDHERLASEYLESLNKSVASPQP